MQAFCAYFTFHMSMILLLYPNLIAKAAYDPILQRIFWNQKHQESFTSYYVEVQLKEGRNIISVLDEKRVHFYQIVKVSWKNVTQTLVVIGTEELAIRILLSVPQKNESNRIVFIEKPSDISGDDEGNLYLTFCGLNQLFILKRKSFTDDEESHRSPEYVMKLLGGNSNYTAGITADGKTLQHHAVFCPWGIHVISSTRLYFLERGSCSLKLVQTGILQTVGQVAKCQMNFSEPFLSRNDALTYLDLKTGQTLTTTSNYIIASNTAMINTKMRRRMPTFLSAELNTTVSLGSLGLDGSVLTGGSAGNYVGCSVSGAGDVNKDGYADFIIGASGYPPSAFGSANGRAYLIYGGASIDSTISLDYIGLSGIILSGQSSTQAGYSVSGAGDVNNDGYDDFLVGAPGSDFTWSYAYLIFGGSNLPNTMSLGSVGLGVVLTWAGNNNAAGSFVSGAGDVNHDGYADFLVAKSGTVFLLFGGNSLPSSISLESIGSAGIIITGASPSSLSSAGDFNHDGYSDFLIGESGFVGNVNNGYVGVNGQVYLIFGGASLPGTISVVTLGSSGITFSGESTVYPGISSGVGSSVAVAGDVNGDGFSDIVIGASAYSSGSGMSYLIFGGPSLPSSISLVSLGAAGVTFAGESGSSAGSSVASAGDVNQDRFSDFLIGADSFSSGSGAVYLIFGGSSLSSSISLGSLGESGDVFVGVSSSSAGSSVAGVEDVNKDGFNDFIIGAKGFDSSTGTAYLILGNYLPTWMPTSQPSAQPSQPTSPPSSQPSSQPTDRPSAQPTCQPTRQPTKRPSSQPTNRPSAQPSRLPTAKPSSQPIERPSSQPTDRPSAQPTSQPTRQPTKRPSTQPTNRPSAQPSRLPTAKPSSQPTQEPSQPTSEPSKMPAAHPSTQPSSIPSTAPSNSPSNSPSYIPSAQPSSPPSDRPSIRPSSAPSCDPSTQPSSIPSTAPSNSPSNSPSYIPSAQPSSQPSDRPSIRPSSAPSCDPSTQPSSIPSTAPSSSPSNSPSYIPSAQPSSPPSDRPSIRPSSAPSCDPSTQPSSIPSTAPSSSPSNSPSYIPSAQPSSPPSDRPSIRPSSAPSCDPSTQPSSIPSTAPSSSPSNSPSYIPSAQPSSPPSDRPSIRPSSAPSCDPSTQPSSIPSTAPSSSPSNSPSYIPSAQPSSPPSDRPSIRPSSAPSCDPSTQPSSTPSTAPSNSPSNSPSYLPSAQPSSPPSDRPSIRPSSAPSCDPSTQPSSIPSTAPSNSPSNSPSYIPSAQPSNQPPYTRSETPNAHLLQHSSFSPSPSSSPLIFVPLTKNMSVELMTVDSNDTNWKELLCLIGVFASSVDKVFQPLDVSNPNAGLSYILFGSRALSFQGTINAASSNDYTTISSSFAFRRDIVSRTTLIPGDLNHDGLNDLILCNPLSSTCYFFFSTDEGISNLPVGSTIHGTSSSDYLGFSVASLINTHAEGGFDVIICALSKSTCYVLYGQISWPENIFVSQITSANGYQVISTGSNIALLGISVAGAGDMNNDGYYDIAVSAMTSKGYTVYVISGNGDGKNVLLSEVGNGFGGFLIVGEAGYYTGFSVSGVGDVNGDGLPDLAIGKLPYPGMKDAQSSIIIFGNSKSVDLMLSSDNQEVARMLEIKGAGFIVSGIGDINHDGIADVLLTASDNYVGQSNAYIVTYPTSITSLPTLQPTSSPSSYPPSSSSTGSTFLNHSALPTLLIPTKQQSHRPSQQTSYPIQQSTIRPSSSLMQPTLATLKTRTAHPTYRPSHFLSTFVSFKPSIRPSFNLGDFNEIIVIRKEGFYIGASGNQTFEIVGSGIIEITGEGESGGNIYVIYPPASPETNTTVIITNFNIQNDIINLRNLPSVNNVHEISYSNNPLTMYLTKNVQVICSSLKFNRPNQIRFVFAGDIAGATNVIMELLNPFTISAIVILIVCGLFVLVGWCEQQIPVPNDFKHRSSEDEILENQQIIFSNMQRDNILESRMSSYQKEFTDSDIIESNGLRESSHRGSGRSDSSESNSSGSSDSSTSSSAVSSSNQSSYSSFE